MIEALLIGLGVFKIVDLLKEITVDYGPWPAWVKSASTLVISGVAAALWLPSLAAIPVALGAAGVSALAHEIHARLNLSNSQTLLDLRTGRSRRS